MVVVMISLTPIQRYIDISDIFNKVVRSNSRNQNCLGNHAIVRLLCPITQMLNTSGDIIGNNFYLSAFQQ